MIFPKRIQKEPKGPGHIPRIRSQAHLEFVRDHECSVPGCTMRPIETHHVRLGAHAGMSQKPDDDTVVSLCKAHHVEVHNIGQLTFDGKHKIDSASLAREFAKRSDPLRRYFQSHPQMRRKK